MKATLKRALSVLCALALCIGLLPVSALAAEEVAQNEYIKFDYESPITSGEMGTVTIIVQDSDGKELGDPIIINDYYKTVAHPNTLSLMTDQYEIESVTVSRGTKVNLSSSQNEVTFSWTFTADQATLYVTLCEPFESPVIIGGEINRTSVGYRIYDNQVLKMLAASGVSVSETTSIEDVNVVFVKSFGMGPDENLVKADRELDYRHNTFTSNSADPSEVQPTNIRKLVITYDNGDGEKTLSIYSGDLRYVKEDEASTPYFNIELNNDDIHVVNFYNEDGANLGNNYSLYAVRVVNDGTSLGSNMPDDPTYPYTAYRFVGWEQNGWTGDGAQFTRGTIVNGDLNVFAHKVSTEEDGGSEYHILYEDQIIARFVELYNSKNGTTVTASDVDADSIRIAVNGQGSEATNPDYAGNRWALLDDYYLICNYGVPSLLPGAYGNTHIPHTQLTGITVYAEVNGEEDSVFIPYDPDSTMAGNIEQVQQTQENVVELRIIQPPKAPDDEDLNGDP